MRGTLTPGSICYLKEMKCFYGEGKGNWINWKLDPKALIQKRKLVVLFLGDFGPNEVDHERIDAILKSFGYIKDPSAAMETPGEGNSDGPKAAGPSLVHGNGDGQNTDDNRNPATPIRPPESGNADVDPLSANRD